MKHPLLTTLVVAGVAATFAASPALVSADTVALPACDFTNGVPKGLTYQNLVTIQQLGPWAYMKTAHPICNALIGKGDISLPLPQNVDKTISWPVPVQAPTTTATPTPKPQPTPQLLAAETQAPPQVRTLPDTGSSLVDIIIAAAPAMIVPSLVRRFQRSC